MFRADNPDWWRYAAAAASVVLVTGLRLLLNPFLALRVPFVLYMLDILLVGWYAGFGPALLATLLSVTATWLIYLSPHWQLSVAPADLYAGILCLACALLGAAFGARLRAQRLVIDRRRDWQVATLDSIADGVLTCDESGAITYMNAAAESITAWTRNDAKGRRYEEVVRLRRSAPGTDDQSLRLTGRDGHTCEVTVDHRRVGTGARARGGEVRVLHDISRQHQAWQALQESEQRFRLIFEADLIGIFFAYRDGTVTAANDAFLRLLGMPRAQFEHGGLDWSRQTHRDDIDVDRRKLQETITEGRGTRYEKRFLRVDDGRPVWTQVTACRTSGDQLVVFALDVDERRHMQDRQRRRDEELRALTDNVPHMVWVADARGRRNDFNRRWYAYTGLTHAADWRDAVHPDDLSRSEVAMDHALHTGRRTVLDERYRRHDGSYRRHRVQLVPIRNGEGRVIRWYATCTDIDDPRG